MSTESVKIDTDILNRIRKQTKRSGQTIIGFINISLSHTLDHLENNQAVFQPPPTIEYPACFNKVSKYLNKESNKKKK